MFSIDIENGISNEYIKVISGREFNIMISTFRFRYRIFQSSFVGDCRLPVHVVWSMTSRYEESFKSFFADCILW